MGYRTSIREQWRDGVSGEATIQYTTIALQTVFLFVCCSTSLRMQSLNQRLYYIVITPPTIHVVVYPAALHCGNGN